MSACLLPRPIKSVFFILDFLFNHLSYLKILYKYYLFSYNLFYHYKYFNNNLFILLFI
jgi:hypothetical protein